MVNKTLPKFEVQSRHEFFLLFQQKKKKKKEVLTSFEQQSGIVTKHM